MRSPTPFSAPLGGMSLAVLCALLPACTIEPIPFNPGLIETAAAVVEGVAGDAPRLPSGPLHDASEMARRMPAVMLFVRSLGGVSHTRQEDSPLADIALGSLALAALARRVSGAR